MTSEERFFESLKGLNLKKETLEEIKLTSNSMLAAYRLKEPELGDAFKSDIKRLILKDVRG